MIVSIKVSGSKKKEEKNNFSFDEEKRRLLGVSDNMLRDVMENERENVMMMLMSRFKRLRYEDLEEVYSDGCLVLWKKMIDDDYVLMEESLGGFLRKVCWNIGKHYLRNLNLCTHLVIYQMKKKKKKLSLKIYSLSCKICEIILTLP